MYNSIDIDKAVEHLKTLVDNIRCGVCDKTSGTRFRYACGHTSCQDCVVLAADCSLCLTPPQSTSEPVLDNPLTKRAANALNLLKVFENEFHINVYRRKRISEQLKVEKELFPECIQAPIKYSNKRKSFNNSKLNKENRLSQLPGEDMSFISNHEMEKQRENVEMWLSKYVRKPFADLNSNDERLRHGRKVINKYNATENESTPKKRSMRNRSPKKMALSDVKNQCLVVDHLSPVKKTQNPHKKPRIEVTSVKPDTSKYNNICLSIRDPDNDESGIAMDDEAVIVIDDSQSITVDKDLNAWLAVQEAERKKILSSSEHDPRSIEVTPLQEKAIESEIKLTAKVPFYLKSCLSKACTDCNNIEQLENSSDMINKPGSCNTESAKDVSITVENKSFIAIITIRHDQTRRKTNSMHSVDVQTDLTEAKIDNENKLDKKNCEPQSENVFQDNGKVIVNSDQEMCMKHFNKTENVIIEESDSDEDIEASVSLEVKAEIHRSCEEVDYGILSDIEDLEEHSKRPRRGPRGLTPTSTDSSEKENYNPNRIKKTPTSKKKTNKK